jgi:hypothetical protein
MTNERTFNSVHAADITHAADLIIAGAERNGLDAVTAAWLVFDHSEQRVHVAADRAIADNIIADVKLTAPDTCSLSYLLNLALDRIDP